VALSGLGGALTRLGRTSEALKLERKEAAARGDVALEEAFGREDGAAEAKFREAIAALEARAASGAMVNEVQIALMHLRVKDLNRALDWLERAYDSHNPNLPSINNRRPFDPLRSHPRFQALLQRMRLPQ
jgi:hypothetical protein